MLKKERPLVNVCGGALASDEIVGNVLSSKNTGEYVMAKSVTWYTFTGADVTDPKIAKYNNPIKKQKICTFTNQQEKKKKHQTVSEDEFESLGNVLAQFDQKQLDLKHILQWSITRTICSKVNQRKSSPYLDTIYSSYLLYHLQQ